MAEGSSVPLLGSGFPVSRVLGFEFDRRNRRSLAVI
jgi:hypothetical protein